jgi:hypothetical protein
LARERRTKKIAIAPLIAPRMAAVAGTAMRTMPPPMLDPTARELRETANGRADLLAERAG